MRRLSALTAFLLILTVRTSTAQTALRLRWALETDSGATFTLTNSGARPLAAGGWAIYFSALHSPR